jgi:hypothetical protein
MTIHAPARNAGFLFLQGVKRPAHRAGLVGCAMLRIDLTDMMSNDRLIS